MVNIPIIYVEGKSNKIFYEQLRELENTFVQNGGSCIDIKKKVLSEKNSFGIVDHDYENNFHEKLFPIDYYSIENISLIRMEEFNELRTSIQQHINQHNIESARIHKCTSNIIRDKDKRPINFKVELSAVKHHIQYENYINSKIISANSFFKYKDIKIVVEKYIGFYKEKNSEQINHVTNLIESLTAASVTEIFDTSTLRRFNLSLS